MNEFSILCRVLGSLFYRQPDDALLAPLYALIQQGKLQESWPLEQSALLGRLQQASTESGAILADYQALFVGDACRVSPLRSAWVEGSTDADIRVFLSARGMTLSEGPADHFGTLLLAASWLEDHAAEDETEALIHLFTDAILPWYEIFLGKVEAHATSAFWRTMAPLAREAIEAMWDELEEDEVEQPE